jgi:Tol biopolymer transport system component
MWRTTVVGHLSYRWPSFLPDGRRVLFFLRGNDERGVYLAEAGSETITPILPGAAYAASYALSGHLLTVRDGVLLAYPVDSASLQVTGDPVRVADRVAGSSTLSASFSVSPTGVLAYAGGLLTPSRLEWMDRGGKSLGAVTDTGDYAQFRLIPDGKRLAFALVDPASNTSDIWLADLSRNVPRKFTFDPGVDVVPVWSPQVDRIVFRSDRRGGNFPFVKSTTVDAAEDLLAPFQAAFPTDWSPDGALIAFHNESLTTSSYDIGVLAAAGGQKPTPFAQTPFNEFGARFSRDGRWIAYTSNESGRLDVYVAAFPQSGKSYRVSTAGGSEPQWCADGRELFYLAPDRKIMAVDVRSGATFEAGTPRVLFQTRVPFPGSSYRTNYEALPTGERFLVNVPVEDAPSSAINVILNWDAAIER